MLNKRIRRAECHTPGKKRGTHKEQARTARTSSEEEILNKPAENQRHRKERRETNTHLRINRNTKRSKTGVTEKKKKE